MFSKLTFIGMNIVLEAALLAVSATESDFNLNLHHTANTRPKLKQAHSSLTFFYDISIFLDFAAGLSIGNRSALSPGQNESQ